VVRRPIFLPRSPRPKRARRSILANLSAINEHLLTTRGFALSREDLAAIEGAFAVFFRYGPNLRYSTIGAVRVVDRSPRTPI
jgi:hypothetical protein